MDCGISIAVNKQNVLWIVVQDVLRHYVVVYMKIWWPYRFLDRLQ